VFANSAAVARIASTRLAAEGMPPEPKRDHCKDEADETTDAVKNSDFVPFAYRHGTRPARQTAELSGDCKVQAEIAPAFSLPAGSAFSRQKNVAFKP
jgi:hypothetical protein